MTRRRRSYSPQEIRDVADANRATDAWNAGERRGYRGEPKGGRYQFRPEFEEGFAAGEARRRQEGTK